MLDFDITHLELEGKMETVKLFDNIVVAILQNNLLSWFFVVMAVIAFFPHAHKKGTDPETQGIGYLFGPALFLMVTVAWMLIHVESFKFVMITVGFFFAGVNRIRDARKNRGPKLLFQAIAAICSFFMFFLFFWHLVQSILILW